MTDQMSLTTPSTGMSRDDEVKFIENMIESVNRDMAKMDPDVMVERMKDFMGQTREALTQVGESVKAARPRPAATKAKAKAKADAPTASTAVLSTDELKALGLDSTGVTTAESIKAFTDSLKEDPETAAMMKMMESQFGKLNKALGDSMSIARAKMRCFVAGLTIGVVATGWVWPMMYSMECVV